jgi:hypothetical protein
MTLRDALVSRGWSEQDARRVDAAFVGRDWSLKPNRWLSREDFDRLRVRLSDILPTGCIVRQGDDVLTVVRDERGIPSIAAPDGRPLFRLGDSAAVAELFRDFGDVAIEQ